MTEEELLVKIKSNPEEFSTVFNLYYKPIFGYILRRVGDFDDTSDIAADSFYKAFKNVRQFTPKGVSIKIWLYRIATNEVNQYFRNSKRNSNFFERFELESKFQLQNCILEDKEDLEIELHKHHQFLEIQEALKSLPIKYQEVISLRYFEGKDNKEILEILNMNAGTLKSLLSRGLDKLRLKCNHIIFE